MPDLSERLYNPDPAYQDGLADGRNSSADWIREMLVRKFKNKVNGLNIDPAKVSIEMALSDIYTQLEAAETRRDQWGKAILNRDEVDRMAVSLLNLSAQLQCAHSERRGMIMLVVAFLEKYIGQRNGADPVNLSDIPF